MNVIHKARLDVLSSSVVLPYDAKPLSVQSQDGHPTIWYETAQPTDAPSLFRRVRIVPTGAPAPQRFLSDYVGTLQDGLYVWHVYLDLAGPDA